MQLAKPLVSIIILNWNGLDVTIECLESLFKIEYDNFKVILIDNGSSDNSVGILQQKYSDKITIIALEKNIGFTGGNNFGIQYALRNYNSDYYLLLNNDTILDEYFLNNLVEAILQDDKYYAAVPKIFYFEPRDVLWFAGGDISKIIGRVNHYGQFHKDKPEYNIKRPVKFMNGCAALISSAAIQEIGLLDEQFFANSEDADYSLRITKAGRSIIYVPDSIVYHRTSYSFKSNKGKWLGFYLATRNIYLLQRKHLHPLIFPVFIIAFSVRWMFYLTVKLTYLRDLKSVKYLYIGLWDGIRNKLSFPE